MTKHLFTLACALIVGTAHAQFLHNIQYQMSFADLNGATYNQKAASRTLKDGDYLYHVSYSSNTLMGNHLLLKKHHVDGSPAWEASYGIDGPVTFHHGLALTLDGSGNVYVAGATEDLSEGYNALVLKYNSSGSQQWNYSYNSSGSNDDIASSIAVDASGNCYVGGQSDDGINPDAFIFKLTSTGALDWSNSYDYDGREDGAVYLHYADANNIELMAITEGDDFVKELSKITYNSMGVEQTDYRSTVDMSQAMLHDLKRLSNGDYLGCGWTQDPVNGDKDIAVYEFGSDMSTDWSYTYDEAGFDDEARALAVDGNGDIYLTGRTGSSAEAYNMLALQLNATGVEQWKHPMEFAQEVNSMGTAIDLSGGRMLLGGSYAKGTDKAQAVTLLCKKSDGSLLWKDRYTHASHKNDVPNKVYLHSANELLVVGNSFDKENFVVAYEVFNENTQTVTVDGDHIVQNQIAVKLWPDLVNTDVTDNENLSFAWLKDVVNPSTFTWLTDSVDSIPWDSVRCRKVFKSYKSTDVTATGNHGLSVDLPALYCNVVLYFNYDIDEMAMETALSSLDHIFMFAEHDEVGVLCWQPDDPAFVNGDQASLVPTAAYFDVNIGAVKAWDLEKGKEHIKVGIFDTGIFWKHEDFSKDGSGDKDQTKVVGGYSHTQNEEFMDLKFNTTDENEGHGTRLAGVIGAISNNNTGIAGIAGGDASNNEYGVSLLAFKWRQNSVWGTSMSKLAEHVANGAAAGKYQHHVANHSWEGGSRKMLAQAVYASFLEGTIQSCAAGNNDNEKQNCYPADYNDDLVLQVGACADVPKRAIFSNYGFDLDFMAAGVHEVIESTWIENLRQYTSTTGIPTDEYKAPVSTSAAAAHASGVAALLLSHWNKEEAHVQNLVQEDVEYLMEIGAEDMIYTTPEKADPGYDKYTGWGLIKADAALQYLQAPNFDLQHIVSTAAGQNVTQIGTDVEIEVETEDGYTLNAGTYVADVYKVVVSSSHFWSSAYSIHNISSEHPGYWALNSMSNLWDYDESNQTTSGRNGVTFTSTGTPDASGAEMVGYFFYIKEKKRSAWTNKTINQWYPHSNTDDHVLAYSVHLSRGWSLGLSEAQQADFSLYPNPAKNYLNVQARQGSEAMESLILYDLSGKQVDAVYDIHSSQYQYYNAKGLKGMYLVEVSSRNNRTRRKVLFE